ncbi:hypothetical protein KKC13_04545 [bacterium]|nr:hypothetical protein [bacterium]MBU1958316.1 hypothetical protein [bacterium]
MPNHKYLEQFKNAYTSYMRDFPQSKIGEEDVTKMQKYFNYCWENREQEEMKYDVTKYKEEANEFFTAYKTAKGLDWIVNRCNDVSKNFLEYLEKINYQSTAYNKPLFLTIGNVKLEGEDLFTIDNNTLKEKISSCEKYTTPIDFHVWITLPDLSILDMTLDASLLDSEGIRNINSCNMITWREDLLNPYPLKLEYQPLYIHTDISLLID